MANVIISLVISIIFISVILNNLTTTPLSNQIQKEIKG